MCWCGRHFTVVAFREMMRSSNKDVGTELGMEATKAAAALHAQRK
jgi:hypothetical protein